MLALTLLDRAGHDPERRLAEHNEHALTVYARAGFDDDQADHALGAVYSYVLGAAIGETGLTT